MSPIRHDPIRHCILFLVVVVADSVMLRNVMNEKLIPEPQEGGYGTLLTAGNVVGEQDVMAEQFLEEVLLYRNHHRIRKKTQHFVLAD